MPSPFSFDRHERVVHAVSEGASRRQAGEQFGASVPSASRWSKQGRQERQLAPRLSGRDHASHRIDVQVELSLTTYEAQPAIFLHELRSALARHGAQASTSNLSRFFARYDITRKNVAIYAAEQGTGGCKGCPRGLVREPRRPRSAYQPPPHLAEWMASLCQDDTKRLQVPINP